MKHCHGWIVAAAGIRGILVVLLASSIGLAEAVLLTNGSVLTGKVTRWADGCQIELPGGGTVRVPGSQVARIASDKHSLFYFQASHLADDNVESLVQLLQWCIANDLVNEGEQVLARIRQLNPDRTDLGALESMLHEAPASDRVELAPARLGSATLPKSPPPPVGAQALRDFAQHVQPILINRCANAGCHSASPVLGANREDPSRFVLTSLRRAGRQPKPITLANLQAVCSVINTDDPSRSPLLQMARTAHGGAARPPLDATYEQAYQKLVHWINVVAADELARALPGASENAASASGTARGVPLDPNADAPKDPLSPDEFNSKYLVPPSSSSAPAAPSAEAAIDEVGSGEVGFSAEPVTWDP